MTIHRKDLSVSRSKRLLGKHFLVFLGGVLFSAMPTAQGSEDSCSNVADEFAKLVNRASTKVAAKTMTYDQARERLDELTKVEVKTIFPETRSVRTGRKITEIRVRDDAAAIDRYKRHFDEVWEMRVASGQMPPWKLREYRDWLKAQSKTNPPSAYPEIKSKELYDDYFQDNGTINEYLDFQYLNYLEATRAIRPENVEEYLRTLDPSFVKHLGRSAWRKTKAIANSAWGGAIGASVVMFAALPGELVSATLGPWIQPIKEYFTSKAREASTQAVEAVKDWGSLFQGGEDAYVVQLDKLSLLTSTFDQRNFDQMGRVEIAKVFDDYTAQTSAILPQFHRLVLSEQKDFEKTWDQRLIDFRNPILQVNTNYDVQKSLVDRIRSDIEMKGGVASPDQLQRLAEAEKKMKIAEEYIANILADWLFYKQARGKDKPLEPALDRNFATVYELYLISMDPVILGKAMNERVKAHVEQLRQYSQKAQGKKVEGTPSTSKPEDQIKIQTGDGVTPAIQLQNKPK